MKQIEIDNKHSKMRFLDFPGEKNPLLFIHGLGCSSSFDYPNVASAKELIPFRRILVDLIGFGYSDHPPDYNYGITNHVKNLKMLVNKLDVKRINLFGHSMGGAIAIQLASEIQDQVEALVISEGNLDPGGGFYSRKIASYLLSEYEAVGHDRILTDNIESRNDGWVATLKLADPKAVYDGACDLVAGTRPSWRKQLYNLKDIKRTYIFGENSLPDDDEEILRENGINVSIIKNCGHNMATENPIGLSEVIAKAISI